MNSRIRKNDLDFSIKPGDDLYNFVNKKYIDKTKIPKDQVTIGSFYKLSKQIERNIRKICEESKTKKFGKLFWDSMNVDKVESKKIKIEARKFYEKFLDPIKKTKNFEELNNLLIKFSMDCDLIFPFSISIEPNPNNPDELILDAYQSGLTLPDESYYTDDKFSDTQKEYKEFLNKFFKASKMGDGANKLFDLETTIAKLHYNLNELRDVEKTTNIASVDDFKKMIKNVDLNLYLKKMGLGNYKRSINVATLDYIKKIDEFYCSDNFESIKLKVIFDLNYVFLPFFSPTIKKITFDFFSKYLAGKQKRPPKWKTAVNLASSLGWQIAKEYVNKYYSKEHDKKINELIDNLTIAYKDSIENSDWLGQDTKKKALLKLNKIDRKIGHPKVFRDYSTLKLTGKSLLENVIIIGKYKYKKSLEKLDKKVDRTLWYMYPFDVNAYYNPQANEIVFPAAILQPPFFSPDGDEAENYGSIGTIIGHEIGHAFDDQGSKFDENGKKFNWWKKEDEKQFNLLGDRLAKYFDKRKIDGIKDLYVDGRRTLGENIGDLAGLGIALKAFKMTKTYKENKTINSLTPLQRFFISYAISWRTKSTIEYKKLLLANDVHSPAELRTNLIPPHMDEFYEAFDVKKGDKLFLDPKDRIKIW